MKLNIDKHGPLDIHCTRGGIWCLGFKIQVNRKTETQEDGLYVKLHNARYYIRYIMVSQPVNTSQTAKSHTRKHINNKQMLGWGYLRKNNETNRKKRYTDWSR